MRLILALFLFTLSLGAFASELQVFDLKHRTADELIPILKPMLEEGAAITGTGYTLIVRSNKTNRSRIAQLLERLDQAPQQLLIIVEQEGKRQVNRSGFGLSANSRENRVQAELYDNQRKNTGHAMQQLRVLDGQWAMIRSGQAVPQVVHQYSHSATGARVEKRIEYRNVDSGVEVRPRVNGDRVVIDIRPFHARISDGSHIIEQQSLISTVHGRLGDWIDLGGATETGQLSDTGIAYSGSSQTTNHHNIRLKIERIHD